VIIARGAIEIRVRFLVGTRRRSRRPRPTVARTEGLVGTRDGAPVWPPHVEIGPAFIAERAAVAHALRRAAMQAALRRFLAALGLRKTH
jgi:hypothetical protein